MGGVLNANKLPFLLNMNIREAMAEQQQYKRIIADTIYLVRYSLGEDFVKSSK